VRWRIQFVVRTSLQDFRNQDGKRSLDGRVSFPDFNQSISFAVSFATEGQREELRRRRDSLKLKRLQRVHKFPNRASVTWTIDGITDPDVLGSQRSAHETG
jgi:hypothetical protein